LLLSFIKDTKRLNWIYFIFFSICCFTHSSIFIENDDKLSAFLFASLFFSIFISLFISSFLRKQEYEISIWGLASNIEILITMFYQWFFYQKTYKDIWYFMPFIVIYIVAFTLYTWLLFKRKNRERNRQKK
jgi:hypothetical protein